MIIFHQGAVVTGDGRTMVEDCSLALEDGRIVGVGRDLPITGGEVVELEGDLILPGLINHHAHGCTLGPLFASASSPLSEDQVLANLDKHLLGGVTTVLNVDGFATLAEVEAVAVRHPINLKTATCHSPANFKAALAVDGRGLGPEHCNLTIEEMWEQGAVAVGELGSGHTLGGGGQDYMYIPMKIAEATGVTISTGQARELKEAVLGPYLEEEAFQGELVAEKLEEWGLGEYLTPEEAGKLVRQSVLPSLGPARDGIREGAAVARQLGAPLIIHNAPPTKRLLEELVREDGKIVAGHSNHDSFSPAQALEHAQNLREAGAVIDVATFDAFGARETTPSPDHFYAFIEAGIADLLSTDYGGGLFDPPLAGVKAALERGLDNLPRLVAMLTSRVARVFPRLAPERGLLAEGMIADLIVVSRENPEQVKSVYVAGVKVGEGGRVLSRAGVRV